MSFCCTHRRLKLSRISDIYRNPVNQGITMTRKTFEELRYRFTPTSVYKNFGKVYCDVKDEELLTAFEGAGGAKDNVEPHFVTEAEFRVERPEEVPIELFLITWLDIH